MAERRFYFNDISGAIAEAYHQKEMGAALVKVGQEAGSSEWYVRAIDKPTPKGA